jgi:hypothetical protein
VDSGKFRRNGRVHDARGRTSGAHCQGDAWPDASFDVVVRLFLEAKTGPFIQTVKALLQDPARLKAWRNEIEELMSEYLHDNVVRHEYLLIRAIKV